MSTKNTTETAAKRDVTKLQRAIVDGLEDVKAQDIQVFNTEHLTSLFERVIVAAGTSNRQTKALASSVIDSVREAGFPKPRVEGEDNGEWIIVDCGPAVVHIMQPVIRQYYRLEEIWGEKPVRLRIGAAKLTPAKQAEADAAPKSKAKAKPKAVAKAVETEEAAPAKPARKRAAPAKKAATASAAPAKKAAASKTATAKAAPAKKAASATGTAAPRKRAASSAGTTASQTMQRLVVNAPSKKPAAAKRAAAASRKKAS